MDKNRDKELIEALEMVDTLTAQLQLAQHEHGMIPAEEVDKTITRAGKLLKKYGYPSDMADL